MIKKEDISQIFETARIEEVVGDFVKLNRRGVNYIGLCPFHNEKTPSFTVSPSKGIYKCFGCGKAGNAVNFIMEHEKYSYPEALRYLAQKYNIEIEEEEQTPERIAELNEMESMFSLNAFAQKYFSYKLFNSDEGLAIGLSYLKERDFREETIKKFQLGYSIDSWEDFTGHALKNAYKLEYLSKTGLTIIKENKKFDRFKGRIMFPIHNLTGKVIGFGGRTLSSDKNVAKYLNSPESEIYNKSNSLYGIFFARNSIVKNDNCYLVEGYTDVISLHQAGFENTVASSGTSLTSGQIRIIKRYTKNITILYDGDEAGLKASFRGIDMILESGMNVKIVLFPEGEDPDSFVRKHRTSEVEDFLDNSAANFISFKTRMLMKDAAADPIKKAELVKEIVKTIALIPDAIFRSFFVKECSTIMDVPEQTLMNELNKERRKKIQKAVKELRKQDDIQITEEYVAEKQPDTEIVTDHIALQEKEIIRILLNYGKDVFTLENISPQQKKESIDVNIAGFIVNDLKTDDITFSNELYREIFQVYSDSLSEESVPDEKEFIHHENDEIRALAINLLSSPYVLSDNWEKKKIIVPREADKLKQLVTSALLSYKSKVLEKMIVDQQNELKTISDEEDLLIIIQKLKMLKQKSIEINSKLSRIIIK